jgi:hypothetical protein
MAAELLVAAGHQKPARLVYLSSGMHHGVHANLDDLEAGPKTQVWLAVSDDPAAKVTGGYFYHEKPRKPNPAASKKAVQDRFLEECARLSGVTLPTA